MNLLTFDIEDWFHCDMSSCYKTWDNYQSRLPECTDRILGLLEDHNLTATFFVLGWIGKKHPKTIQKIADAGHEIGAHSDLHRIVFEMQPDVFKQDTENVIKTLQDTVGAPITMYRAPAFSITQQTPWAFDCLAESGITIDCSIFPMVRDYGGFLGNSFEGPLRIKRGQTTVKEFPINTAKFCTSKIVFSGGGYFRLTPYWLIHYLTKKSEYVMTYFHPRDFDQDQPVLTHLSWKRRFKSYYGLRTAYRKLERFVQDFDFVSVGTADREIDWSHTPTIDL